MGYACGHVPSCCATRCAAVERDINACVNTIHNSLPLYALSEARGCLDVPNMLLGRLLLRHAYRMHASHQMGVHALHASDVCQLGLLQQGWLYCACFLIFNVLRPGGMCHGPPAQRA